ncbi:DNA polymerase I B, chloroplastic mitochondrial-like [Olea europaea subsp. europaea]|uniref:DNA-directed DNA polymerase n=1 Tax=Olea europaea subsp. europaea TaxID=158383 RepID=A0A8S0TPC9_OLEEU|nr:DNA polymerase I B, chloroplastic mitochondrial-like [Olea europaea subsp. europaea]
MANLGFSTQANPFKHSSFSPPYFWFCRSCTNAYSSSSRTIWACSRKALRRTDDFKLESANGFLSTSVDSHQLIQRSSYSTVQHDESQLHYQRRYTYPSPHSKMPFVHREGKSTEEVNGEVWGSHVTLGHTAEAWGKAAEECKMNKALFAHKEKIAVNLRTLPENTAEGAKLGVIEESSECIEMYKGDGSRPISKEMEYRVNVGQFRSPVLHNPLSIDDVRSNKVCMHNDNGSMSLQNQSLLEGALPNRLLLEDNVENGKDEVSKIVNELAVDEIKNGAADHKCVIADTANGTRIEQITHEPKNILKGLCSVYDKVLVVNSITAAREVVGLLTNQYRHLVHACDTEVANIDVKEETPVDHGEIICFSIYSGPEVDFGNGKSCVWVDVLDGGGKNLIAEFAPFFKDSSIKKVWHNYSFDNHIVENYGLKVSGFFADTMHMARLWNSSRRTEGGYSLEALTGDPSVMSDAKPHPGEEMIGKVSMKTIFGRKKLKKDGSEGKIMVIPPVKELQRVERKLWICYSALDSISTLKLYESLRCKLSNMPWNLDGVLEGSMFNFYEKYWCPFGELLVKMETEGMLVDRAYLSEVEKVAKAEQQVAADRFRKWASKHCPDARYMNVGSDAQLRQFFFGGIQNRKDANEFLPLEKDFKVPNTDKLIEEGKKSPKKYRKIILHKPLDVNIEADVYTASGWPSVSGDALKGLAGKVSVDFDFVDEENVEEVPNAGDGEACEDPDKSAYGAAYTAFGGGQAGVEACNAIAALCEVCSIDSLISNFILPLQGNHISGKEGRIHCSLNINTETGRLSARRPNLQNQPALEKDRYKIRQAFIAAPDNSLIVADYGQLELRILAHLANCKSMLDAFEAGGDFHSRTAMNMYPHIREAVEQKHVLLEWHPEPGEYKPPAPLLKDAFASERRKAKMLNFSIAYGKTTVGLARDWKVSVKEAKETVDRWYSDRQEVLSWQKKRKKEALVNGCVHTLLGRARKFPSLRNATPWHKSHIERAAINTPVQGSAADVAMCAMLEISKNAQLKELGWRLLLQVHDEVILEGPTESAEVAKDLVVDCMSKPFDGKNILKVDLSVDAKYAKNWYSAK